MNKSIKKYLLLLIAVFMIGESRVSASYVKGDLSAVMRGEVGSSVAASGAIAEIGFLAGDATIMLFAEAMRDKRAFKKTSDLVFRLVWEGKLLELQQLWKTMSKEEKKNLFNEIKPYDSWRSITTGTVLHYAALRGHFDVLGWLITELCVCDGRTTWESSYRLSRYFNNGSLLYQEKPEDKQGFSDNHCHDNVLNCLYPWMYKCRSHKEAEGYLNCMRLLLEKGACLSDSNGFSDDNHNIVCYSKEHISERSQSLDFRRDLSLDQKRYASGLHPSSINSILDCINNRIHAQITEKRQQKLKWMFRGVVALGFCAFAYKKNLYQRLKLFSVKSLIAGGFNFFGHRALAAGQALSH